MVGIYGTEKMSRMISIKLDQFNKTHSFVYLPSPQVNLAHFAECSRGGFTDLCMRQIYTLATRA